MKINAVKFLAHQSLCNPPISSLLKAINAGFLTGAPNLDAHMVCKYLMASPATSKGHMKRPRKGLQSTTRKTPNANANTTPQRNNPEAVQVNESESEIGNDESSEEEEPQEEYFSNIIPEVEDESIANVFCFGAFADKMTGVV
jgi:hypothetical protein